MNAEEPAGKLRYVYRRHDRLSAMVVDSLAAGITLASYSMAFQEASPVGFYCEATNQVWLYCYLKTYYALLDIRQTLKLPGEHTFQRIEKFNVTQVL